MKLHSGDGVLGLTRRVGFVPDVAFSFKAKISVLVSSDQRTFFHMFGEFPHIPVGEPFYKQWLFF